MLSESQLRFVMTFRDQATQQLARVGDATAQVGRQAAAAQTQVNGFDRTISRMDNTVSAFAARLRLLARDLRSFSGTAAAASGVGAYFSGQLFLEQAGGFEQNLAVFRTLSGATTQQMSGLENQVLAIGSATAKTSNEVLEGALALQKMGRSVEEVQAILPSLTDFSVVSGMSMDQAARVAGSTLTQFQLQVDQTQRVMDVLMRGAHQSQADVDEFAIALSYAGSEARNANIPLEDTIALMEAASQAGIPGSRLGTGLQSVLNDFYMANDRQKAMYEQYGIQMRDAAGVPRDIYEAMQEVFDKIPASMYGRFETDTARFLMGIRSQGLDAVRAFRTDLDADARGEGARVGAAYMEGLKGAWERMGGAIETLLVKIGQSGMTRWVAEMADKMGDLASRMSQADTETLLFAGTMGALLLALNPIMFALGGVLTVLTSLEGLLLAGGVLLAVTHWTQFKDAMFAVADVAMNWQKYLSDWMVEHPILTAAIQGTTAALVLMIVAMNIGAVVRWISLVALITAGTVQWKIAQLALNLAMRLNPIGLLVTALAGLTIGMASYINATSVAARAQRDLNKAQEENQAIRSGLINESDDFVGNRAAAARMRSDYLRERLSEVTSQLAATQAREAAMGGGGDRTEVSERGRLQRRAEELRAQVSSLQGQIAEVGQTQAAARAEQLRRARAAADGGVPVVNPEFNPGPTGLDTGGDGTGGGNGKSLADRLADFLSNARQQISAMRDTREEQDRLNVLRTLGLEGMDRERMSQEQLNAVRDAGSAQNDIRAAQREQEIRQMGLETEAVRARAEIARMDNAAQAEATAILEARIEMARAANVGTLEGIVLTREQIEAIRASVAAHRELETASKGVYASMRDAITEWANKAKDVGTQAANVMTQGIGGAVDQLTNMLTGQETSWKQWGFTILQMITKIIVQLLVMKAIQSATAAFGFSNGGSFMGETDPSSLYARGGIFQKFANGGGFTNSIVNQPTAFRFGKGGSKLGIMGEAGPEAIMPLRRLANGRLGVEASGGGGGSAVFAPQVNITINGGEGGASMDEESLKLLTQAIDATLTKKMEDFHRQQQRNSGHLTSAR